MKDLQELPKLRDSVTYIYFEHAIIEQDAQSIVAIRKDGRVPIPVAATTCLLLGPGTSITHAAIRTIGENECISPTHVGMNRTVSQLTSVMVD